MKRKLTFILALVISFCFWLVCSPGVGVKKWLLDRTLNPAKATMLRTDASAAAGTWRKKLKTPWTDTKAVLYRSNGEVVQLDAKAAVYTVCSTKPLTNPTNLHKPFDIPVMAFIDPVTSNFWFGEANMGQQVESNGPVYTNLFIETGSEIIRADNVMYDGIFDWDDSMVKKLPAGAGWEALTNYVETTPGDSWPFAGTLWEINLKPCFREDFFDQREIMHGDESVSHIEMTGGKLRLDFSNPDSKAQASVWIDLTIPKVLKTTETKPDQTALQKDFSNFPH
ncbi:MAG TPA: hypothetical protein VG347_23880 [Verrucomicrobiae bacterium]|nr:hypothetical protein [Verrucomicrobiae bacterium]